VSRLRGLLPVFALLLAALVALCAAVVGIYVSYWGDVPSGPAIVLVLTVLLGVALASRRRGLR